MIQASATIGTVHVQLPTAVISVDSVSVVHRCAKSARSVNGLMSEHIRLQRMNVNVLQHLAVL